MDKFEEYKVQIQAEHSDYKTLFVSKDSMLQNAEDTSGRNAPKGFSWIDYWRAMSGNHKSVLECSSCGKMIFADGIPPMMAKIYSKMELDENQHIAVGGHLLVPEPHASDYAGGFYIAPLCQKCNALRGENIIIRKGSILCKEFMTDQSN